MLNNWANFAFKRAACTRTLCTLSRYICGTSCERKSRERERRTLAASPPSSSFSRRSRCSGLNFNWFSPVVRNQRGTAHHCRGASSSRSPSLSSASTFFLLHVSGCARLFPSTGCAFYFSLSLFLFLPPSSLFLPTDSLFIFLVLRLFIT